MVKKMIIPSVKGTREFYPDGMALRNYIYQNVKKAAQLFGYQEWDGPFIESIDLYAAKSGEELVKEQAFVFPDRSGEMITLRPELTPSLARMIAQKQGELAFPVRWWSFGPFWRYERPQKGRSREFFQWNVDMLGVNSPEADAELIAVAVTFLKFLGLSPDLTQIYVNNRRLMEQQFSVLNIPPEKRMVVSSALDRRNKVEPSKWEQDVLDLGINKDQLDGLKKILTDYELWKQSDELIRLFKALDVLGVSEYVKFDPNIMRGLLYYTGTVFEAFDVSGSVRRAILGGGRYDNLLSDVGGEPLSGVGFAMGDVVVGLILREKGLIPTFVPSPAPILVTIFDESLWMKSYSVAASLREEGYNVLVYPEPSRLNKQFKFGDRMGVKIAIVIGPEEADQGTVTLKNLMNSDQNTVLIAEVGKQIQKILDNH